MGFNLIEYTYSTYSCIPFTSCSSHVLCVPPAPVVPSEYFSPCDPASLSTPLCQTLIHTFHTAHIDGFPFKYFGDFGSYDWWGCASDQTNELRIIRFAGDIQKMDAGDGCLLKENSWNDCLFILGKQRRNCLRSSYLSVKTTLISEHLSSWCILVTLRYVGSGVASLQGGPAVPVHHDREGHHGEGGGGSGHQGVRSDSSSWSVLAVWSVRHSGGRHQTEEATWPALQTGRQDSTERQVNTSKTGSNVKFYICPTAGTFTALQQRGQKKGKTGRVHYDIKQSGKHTLIEYKSKEYTPGRIHVLRSIL